MTETEFETEMRGCFSFVRGYARKLAGFTLADDLVQSAFIKAWRARDTYDPARAPFGRWVARIVLNQHRDDLRVKRNQEMPFSNCQSTLNNSPAERMHGTREDGHGNRPVMDAEEQACSRLEVQDYLNALTERERTIVHALVQGTTDREIARGLGITVPMLHTEIGLMQTRMNAQFPDAVSQWRRACHPKYE